MSERTAASTGRKYGVERVCSAWDMPRSSFYLHHCLLDQAYDALCHLRLKRGPKTEISDDNLLVHIRADLASSPFQGEGYRKVWARMKVLKSIQTSPKRVLRIMRENHLLSPYRSLQGAAIEHNGHIITDEPNVMWGTDGTRIFTVNDGWVWLFTAVEHWNSECVGWHVCKFGSRYAALEPVAMGLQEIFGSVSAGVARGLSIRMDHGTQYTSEHFLNQIRFWGTAPSFAFVEQPQTNGVAERFNRTLKEQVIHGRVFYDLEEVRRVVGAFIELYNQHWMVQKLGYKTPCQARELAELPLAA